MKNLVITRHMDAEYRIAIPVDLRRKLQISSNDYLIFQLEGDKIVVKYTEDRCAVCLSKDGLVKFKNKHICNKCITYIRED